MKNIFKMSLLLTAATLAACGGGGGSGGVSEQQYSITLRSDLSQLPLNINPAQNVASTGAYSPYTTTLYVNAETGGKPIPGGEDTFACNLDGGLDSGALYYLDGDTEHENEDGSPKGYRSIVKGANSGGASFHFHASNKVGTARIVCSVQDPRDSKIYSASTTITVGAATGKPAWIVGRSQMTTLLGTSQNVSNLPSTGAVQATIYDDANQPVPNPGAANLQVSIRPGEAATGAQLVVNGKASTVAQVTSMGGVGQFSLKSGPNAGPILLEFVSDRADNNVANGIQQPVTSLLVIDAVHEMEAKEPLALQTENIDATAVNGIPFSFMLAAEGGAAPYTWTLAGGTLPTGLTLSSSGLISGTPAVKKIGSYPVVIRVTDRQGHMVQSNMAINVEGAPLVDPLVISMSGCSGGINSVCALPDAHMGENYQYTFSAVGGDPNVAVTWSFSALPAWLKGNSQGNYGYLNGTPDWSESIPEGGTAPVITGQTCGKVGFLVTATRGSVTASRQLSLNVVKGTKDCPGTTPATPPTTP
ncbi:Ig domain-containing protein [Diaphorobacter sp.]|uniref:Ig domain-containing protein n=1 Tax=Diaphorobacter sp. TaxID=1934310 RepID=UPI0028ADEC5E|nr:Ig domain-containing protein [Diaphorobacter sp.]